MTDFLSLYHRDSSVMELAREYPGAFEIGMRLGAAAATDVDVDCLPGRRPLAYEVCGRMYEQLPFLHITGAFVQAERYREFNAVQAGAEYAIVSTLTV